jgi:hypothetical protein
MGLLFDLFSLEELKTLDVKELEILKAAIQKELRTSPAVPNAIRNNVRQVFQNLKAAKPGGSSPPTPQAP